MKIKYGYVVRGGKCRTVSRTCNSYVIKIMHYMHTHTYKYVNIVAG